MRLKRIKLAGFKSFVDPTSVELPSALVGVAGPNGSGKSNIVDGVRWVMGESSARYLRGEAMADVIFNGSTGRQPLGSATVEMVFDNSEGRLGGEYANWSEIAIRRTVDREGISSYYLNGTRCRRRDITDVFLGTGLGPRSYAIIEQGTISRLVESKPEELREFLEEAAGISRYRERRRETENRIHHTRENLERVDDVLEEVGKQLAHLRRQARAAERYRDLKAEERQRRAELLALRVQTLDEALAEREGEVRARSLEVEAEVTRERGVERELVTARTEHDAAVTEANRIQQRYFELQTEIARLEEGIAAARRERALHEERLQALGERLDENEHRAAADDERGAALRAEAVRLEAELRDAQARAQAAREARDGAEATAEHVRQADAAQREALAEARHRREVVQAGVRAAETREETLCRRTARIGEERARLEAVSGNAASAAAQAEVTDQRQRADAAEAAVAQSEAEVRERRSWLAETAERLASAGRELASVEGRLASLETLIRTGRGSEAVTHWLSAQGLDRARRLAAALDIGAGWEWAVEVALGAHLAAVETETLDAGLAAELNRLAAGELDLVVSGPVVAAAPGTLAAQVNSPFPAVHEWLGGIRTAASGAEALARRDQLEAGESFITREGIWVGRHWVRAARPAEEGEKGVIGLEREREQLATQRAALRYESAAAQNARDEAERRLAEAESRQVQAREAAREAQSVLAAALAAAAETAGRERGANERLAALAVESGEIKTALGELGAERERLAAKLREADEACAVLEPEREAQARALEETRETAQRARAGADEVERAREALALRLESARAQAGAAEETAARLRAERENLATERARLQDRLGESGEPGAELQGELQQRLDAHRRVDGELAAARDQAAAIEARVAEFERSRRAISTHVGELREALESARLVSRELGTRRQGLAEQLDELGTDPAAALAAIELGANADEWERKLEELAQRIQRLGAINLAAIDECAAQAEREDYLKRQRDDLNEALATLEAAIRRIDRETRARFKDAFDRINTRFNELFPRLFGGGSAALVLTGEELLDAGVVVTAHPPGKKNATIQMLSGGEKALVAVALIFAIFELNPAPFCLLDEVDAPMDDSNVERFCSLVREMSERTQFVLITHNRRSMALCHQLIGVTMQEPGVSRLVGVDIDEAERLAVG